MVEPNTMELHSSVVYTPSVRLKKVPAHLTASYDSTQQMFNVAYIHCPITLYWHEVLLREKITMNLGSWGGGGAKLISLCQLLPKQWLKITWRYTMCHPTGWFVPRFGRPQALPHFSRRIGLRSLQGDEPEASWVFWSYYMGLTQLSSSVSKQVYKKRNEKKCWMNGRWWSRGCIVVVVVSRDGRTTAKTEQRKKDKKYVVGGWLEYMTQRQKIL